MRDHYFKEFQLRDVLRMVAAEVAAELGHSGNLLAILGRDFVGGYNQDWRAVD